MRFVIFMLGVAYLSTLEQLFGIHPPEDVDVVYKGISMILGILLILDIADVVSKFKHKGN